MKTLRLFLVAALAAAFLSPLEQRSAEAQSSVLLPPVRTTDAYIQRRAISKIGGAIGSAVNVSWLFDDMVASANSATLAAGWQSLPTGSGVLAMQTISDEGGGVQQLSSGATAASRITQVTNSPLIANPSNKPWYVAHRTKITTAVTAQSKIYAGLIEPNVTGNTIAIGFFGNLHATNFVAQYDGGEAGSFVSLAVAADTAYHIFELWSVGDNKLHCAIDFGADICAGVTMASAPVNSMSGRRESLNGTDAVARTCRTDWFAVMSRRN